MLQKLKQLESEVAKLKQNLPCYSVVSKPFDPPEEADFNAAKLVIQEAKSNAIKSLNNVNQEYLARNECCDFLDGLLWILSKTVLNFIAKNKKLLHNAIVDWLKEDITKANHLRNVES